ncbi:hypothetical protein BA953_03870 [Vibrio coralliilyticus]|uniref:hypothetical protein n=1 Tax=Vibrio coralliilyticus TaxID=190893 RepID=UPI000810721D|nr:hypothetical protein [Vibrio coralliilyticus]ANW23414.1 hypothetical protein BA953_03870 [Vibrio coralliilyticus]
MSIPSIHKINECLRNSGFDAIDNQSIVHTEQYISILLERDQNIEQIKSLRDESLISDREIFFSIDWQGPYGEKILIDILSPFERDNTLVINDKNMIHHMCNNIYLSLLKSLVKVGVEIDFNSFLVESLSGEKRELDIFNFLINNFEFENQSLLNSISWIIHNNYYTSSEGRGSFNALLNKGVNLNEKFLSGHFSDYFLDYESILTVAFCHSLEAFKELIELKPNTRAVEEIPWEYVVESHYLNECHINQIEMLAKSGYNLPLQEIADYFEEDDQPEFAYKVLSFAK